MIGRVTDLIKMQEPVCDELLFASGDTVPTATTAGYETGCIFQHTDGAAGTAFYINEGTAASCDFQAVAALTAAQEAALTANTAFVGAIDATEAELNSAADQSANTEDVSEAGELAPAVRNSQIAGGDGYAVTLAAPTAAEVGKLKVVTLESITSSAVTMALTEVIGGTAASSASFDAAGETLVMVGIESAPATFKWLVLKEHGVTLS